MSDEIGEFKRIAIPLIRRIYPQLISNKICSVQPLSSPASLSYYLRSDKEIINSDGWIIKPKNKKIWRDIDDSWEPSHNA